MKKKKSKKDKALELAAEVINMIPTFKKVKPELKDKLVEAFAKCGIEVKMETTKLNLAIELCMKIYDQLKDKGVYPALTGGTLYKKGDRKDIDILLYFKRENKSFETKELEKDLAEIGITDFNYVTGYLCKAKYNNINIDIMNPETESLDDYGDDI